MRWRTQINFYGVLWFPEYKDDFSFVYITANHKKCPPMQWQGQLLLWQEEYFPGKLLGEEDCDGPGQERRNASNSHSTSRMRDTLLALSRLSSRPLRRFLFAPLSQPSTLHPPKLFPRSCHFQNWFLSRLLHPKKINGIWIGQDQYRMPLGPLSEYPEPWFWKVAGRGI